MKNKLIKFRKSLEQTIYYGFEFSYESDNEARRYFNEAFTMEDNIVLYTIPDNKKQLASLIFLDLLIESL